MTSRVVAVSLYGSDEFEKDMKKVGVIMGSTSDWEVMADAVETLERFGVEYEKRVVSAHRTPDLM